MMTKTVFVSLALFAIVCTAPLTGQTPDLTDYFSRLEAPDGAAQSGLWVELNGWLTRDQLSADDVQRVADRLIELLESPVGEVKRGAIAKLIMMAEHKSAVSAQLLSMYWTTEDYAVRGMILRRADIFTNPEATVAHLTLVLQREAKIYREKAMAIAALSNLGDVGIQALEETAREVQFVSPHARAAIARLRREGIIAGAGGGT